MISVNSKYMFNEKSRPFLMCERQTFFSLQCFDNTVSKVLVQTVSKNNYSLVFFLKKLFCNIMHSHFASMSKTAQPSADSLVHILKLTNATE